MILAAGLGTRLQPITNTKPKALVEVRGITLLEYVMRQLLKHGVNEVIINLHHFPDQIKQFIESKNQFDCRIEFSEEPVLLDTGGGLKNAAWFFDDKAPFILHNVDIISDIDLGRMLRQHRENNALVTLAVNSRTTNRYFMFDENDFLCGWKSVQENKEIRAREPQGQITDLAFCGLHVISPAIFAKLTETGRFSIVESYLRLAGENAAIQAFRVDAYNWRDVGKLSEL